MEDLKYSRDLSSNNSLKRIFSSSEKGGAMSTNVNPDSSLGWFGELLEKFIPSDYDLEGESPKEFSVLSSPSKISKGSNQLINFQTFRPTVYGE